MIITRPKKWTRKPPVGTQINWGHSIAQGLRECVLFNDVGNNTPLDLVHNFPSIATGWTVPAGNDNWCVLSGNVPSWTLNTPYNYCAGDYTARFIIQPQLIHSGFDEFFSKGGEFDLFINPSGNFSAVTLGGSTGSDVPMGIAVGQVADVVITRKGSVTQFWLNGVLKDTQVTFTGTGAGGTALKLQGDGGRGTPSVTALSTWQFWDRSLVAAEIQELYKNPYCYLVPPGGSQRKFPPTVSNTTTSKTLTGTSRITATATRTQAGKSDLRVTTAKSLSGLGRITASVSKTQAGTSRFTGTTTKTQAGTSRFTATATKAQAGLSRLTGTVSKAQAGTSRVTASASKTQSGISALIATGSTSRTQSGISRLKATATQTNTGTSRIQTAGIAKTQSGSSRIQVSISRTQSGLSAIAVTGTTTRTISGKGCVRATANRTQGGQARITVQRIQTLAGVSKVLVTATKVQSGAARIQVRVSRAQSGQAQILVLGVGSQSQSGKSRVTATANVQQLGLSRFTRTATRAQSGTANLISAFGLWSQSGVSRILSPFTLEIELLTAIHSLMSNVANSGIDPASGASRTVMVYNMVPQDAVVPYVRLWVTDSTPIDDEPMEFGKSITAKRVMLLIDIFSSYFPEVLNIANTIQQVLDNLQITTPHFNGSTWVNSVDNFVDNVSYPDRVYQRASLRVEARMQRS